MALDDERPPSIDRDLITTAMALRAALGTRSQERLADHFETYVLQHLADGAYRPDPESPLHGVAVAAIEDLRTALATMDEPCAGDAAAFAAEVLAGTPRPLRALPDSRCRHQADRRVIPDTNSHPQSA